MEPAEGRSLRGLRGKRTFASIIFRPGLTEGLRPCFAASPREGIEAKEL